MPYINTTLSIKLSEEERDSLKRRMGEIICDIPGKSEEWLMLGFKDEVSMYFRGEKKEKIAFIDVKIFGKADKQHKEKVNEQICEMFLIQLGIPQENVFVVFSEVEDWGWNGSML